MLMKLNQQMFIIPLITGSLLTISSDSWLIGWVGLEINLMGFIPFLLFKTDSKTIESAIKYFLTQALGSIIIIFSSAMSLSTYNLMSMINLTSLLMYLAIMLKIGAAPFHFWVPQVTKFTEWLPVSILLTWQKLGPLSLISSPKTSIMGIFILSSAILGSIGGMTQTNTKSIMAFSSVSHLAWMLLNLKSSFLVFFTYFSTYCFLTISMISIFNKFKILSISNTLSKPMNFTNKILFMTILLSLGGLPPFPGFLIKLISIKFLWAVSPMMLMFTPFMVLASACSLYFYSRISFFMFASFPTSNKTKILSQNSNQPLSMSIGVIISLTSVLLMSLFLMV